MKCFAIKSGEEYIRDGYRAVTSSYYYGTTLQLTEMEDEAKHYKTASPAKSWVKKNLAKYKEEYEYAQDLYINENAKYQTQKKSSGWASNWEVDRAKKKRDTAQTLVNWLSNAKVIELDIELPNFPSDNKVVWHSWYRDREKKSRMSLKICRTSKYHCKACGVMLKNIPYYEFYEANGMKVCIPCLHLRVDEIVSQYDKMDKKQKDTITNEIILGSI